MTNATYLFVISENANCRDWDLNMAVARALALRGANVNRGRSTTRSKIERILSFTRRTSPMILSRRLAACAEILREISEDLGAMSNRKTQSTWRRNTAMYYSATIEIAWHLPKT